MKIKNIAIIGLGLMGASLAAACRKKFPHARILGISRNPQALRWARSRSWIHEGVQDLRRGVRDADLVVICTPVDVIPQTLTVINRFVKKGTVVTDVGSVKGDLIRWYDKKKKRLNHIRFISAHPMVGSHARGAGAARPHLYDQGYVFLVSTKPKDTAFKAVRFFWKKICSRVIEIPASAHDAIVGQVSHLPHAAAACLVLAVRKDFLRFSSSGFRDATRIAQGHPSIWLPIFLANGEILKKALSRFAREIQKMQELLRRKNGRALSRLLAQAMERRCQISL